METRRNSRGEVLEPSLFDDRSYDDRQLAGRVERVRIDPDRRVDVTDWAIVNRYTDCVLLADDTWIAMAVIEASDEILVFASVVQARRVARRYPGAWAVALWPAG